MKNFIFILINIISICCVSCKQNKSVLLDSVIESTVVDSVDTVFTDGVTGTTIAEVC